MNVFIYRAALLCEDCAKLQMEQLNESFSANGALPGNADDDSDRYPQSPYSNGGGEADCPQHCDCCGVFLENVLTDAGVAYVKEQAAKYDPNDRVGWDTIALRAEEDGKPVLAQWVRHYFAMGQ